MSFQTGDPVKVVKALDEEAERYLGLVGTFVSYAGEGDWFDCWVYFSDRTFSQGFFVTELEAVA